MDPLLRRALEIANRPRRSQRSDDAMNEEPIIEPAHPQARPVYFERNDGVIYGPAQVTHLAKTGAGSNERFWVIVEYEGQVVWIRTDVLRSKKQFETQVKPTVIELMREPR